MILLQLLIYILLKLHIILISLIIYKPSTLIIFPWTFSMQLEAGISLFCLSQCADPDYQRMEKPKHKDTIVYIL